MEVVNFLNVKNRYCVDKEDIVLKYMLGSEVNTLNDWIGLFQRGWLDVSQFLTFEWVVAKPSEKYNPFKTICFQYKLFDGGIDFNMDYQFVYINNTKNVYGTSCFFRFFKLLGPDVGDIPIDKNGTKSFRSKKYSKIRSQHTQPGLNTRGVEANGCHANSYAALPPNPQQLRITESSIGRPILKHGSYLKSETQSSISSHHSSNGIPSCDSCLQPVHSRNIQDALSAKLKGSIEENLQLKELVSRLTGSLEMRDVVERKLRLVAYHLKREQLACRKYVDDMTSNLARYKVIRIIGRKGQRMTVKLLDGQNCNSVPIGTQSQSRERLLKAMIGSQEQTIRKLLQHVNTLQNLSQSKHVSEEAFNNIPMDVGNFHKVMTMHYPKCQPLPPEIVPLDLTLVPDERIGRIPERAVIEHAMIPERAVIPGDDARHSLNEKTLETVFQAMIADLEVEGKDATFEEVYQQVSGGGDDAELSQSASGGEEKLQDDDTVMCRSDPGGMEQGGAEPPCAEAEEYQRGAECEEEGTAIISWEKKPIDEVENICAGLAAIAAGKAEH